MINFVLWVLMMFLVWITALPLIHTGLATTLVVVLTGINITRKLGGKGVIIALAACLIAFAAFMVWQFWPIMRIVLVIALAGVAIRYVWMTWKLLRNRPIKQASWMLMYRVLRLAGFAALIWVLLNPVSLTIFGAVALYWVCSNFRFRQFKFRLF